MTVTRPQDIGTVVARLVLGDGRTGVVFTAGDTVSYEQQLAGFVEGRVGERKSTEREIWGQKSLQAELEKDPQNQIKKYRCIFAEGTGALVGIRTRLRTRNSASKPWI